MKNVLLLRTSSMGDLIHTWPALTDLARHRPELTVSWLAEEGFADIPGLHPLVAPLVLAVSFYAFIEGLARRRGFDPDTPPHLRKVTETV